MTTLVFAASFLALAAVSGLAAAAGRSWAFRLPLLAATPLLALGVWWQLSQRDGWPTGSHPADGSAFVASVVQAPTAGNAGTIYLWAQPPKSDTPRSYRLPYSRELEQRVAQATRATRRGARVGVRATTSRAGSRAATRRQAGQAVRSPSRLQFYRLPPPRLPVKEASGRGR
jgi:hypothetical protein